MKTQRGLVLITTIIVIPTKAVEQGATLSHDQWKVLLWNGKNLHPLVKHTLLRVRAGARTHTYWNTNRFNLFVICTFTIYTFSGPVSASCCHHIHTLQFVVLFPFHSAVLKPYFDLSLWETECVCNLNSSATCQVPVEVELLLKLKCLVACVGCPGPFPLRSGQIVCYTQKCDMFTFII